MNARFFAVVAVLLSLIADLALRERPAAARPPRRGIEEVLKDLDGDARRFARKLVESK